MSQALALAHRSASQPAVNGGAAGAACIAQEVIERIKDPARRKVAARADEVGRQAEIHSYSLPAIILPADSKQDNVCGRSWVQAELALQVMTGAMLSTAQ
jgi:hypothetical protein